MYSVPLIFTLHLLPYATNIYEYRVNKTYTLRDTKTIISNLYIITLFIYFFLFFWLNLFTVLIKWHDRSYDILAYVMSINHLICTGQNFLLWKLGLAYHSISITFEIWDKWSLLSNQRTLSQILMTLKALAHYTRNCKKTQLSSIHITTIFHNCNDFSTAFYMSNDFLTVFFRKIFAVLCVRAFKILRTAVVKAWEIYTLYTDHRVSLVFFISDFMIRWVALRHLC